MECAHARNAKLLLRVFRISARNKNRCALACVCVELHMTTINLLRLAEPSHALVLFVEEPDTPTSVVPVNRLRDCSTQPPQEGSECKVAWTDKKLYMCRVLAVGKSYLCHLLHSGYVHYII